MKIEITGAPLDLADELEEQFAANARDAVGKAGDMLLREVQRRLSSDRGPDPSQPGTAPALQSGALLRSFRRIPPRVRGRVATSGVRTTHPGATRLEYGFVDVRGIRTLPRPYLAPSLNAIASDVEKLMREVVK